MTAIDEARALVAKPEGQKLDAGKPRWDLLPLHGVEAVVRVLTFGAKKYAPGNWQHVPGARWRYLGASLRHIVAWAKGEQRDTETGESHLAHAACCVLFLLDAEERGHEFPPEAP